MASGVFVMDTEWLQQLNNAYAIRRANSTHALDRSHAIISQSIARYRLAHDRVTLLLLTFQRAKIALSARRVQQRLTFLTPHNTTYRQALIKWDALCASAAEKLVFDALSDNSYQYAHSLAQLEVVYTEDIHRAQRLPGSTGLLAATLRNNSMTLNNALAFALQSVMTRSLPGSSSYTPTIVIGGKVARRIGILAAHSGSTPVFAQLYMHDILVNDTLSTIETRHGSMFAHGSFFGDEQARMQNLLERLVQYVHGHNLYAKKIRQCVESVRDPSQLTQLRILFEQNARPMAICYSRCTQDYRCSGGAGAKVAMLNERLVNAADNAVFLSGDNGWVKNMPFSTAAAKTPESSAQHTVDDDADIMLIGCIGETVLKWRQTTIPVFASNQKALRTAQYKEVADFCAAQRHRNDHSSVFRTGVGKRMVLPATFVGGARDMVNRYHDAT
eukprot:6177927-Pleurochrysis_carterae.AAC.1